ncbi:MAG TPA: hypothetical protein VGK57_11580 [Candidatus Binatia bacterium]|jgi:hypothetical protein
MAKGFVLASLFYLTFGLAGCSSQTTLLINPQNGATVRCGASGMGPLMGAASGFVEECFKRYGQQGYVAVDRLTPAQRDDLKRRGLWPETNERGQSM